MKRRDFLKLIGAGVVGTVLPLPTRAGPVDIDKLREGLVFAWRPGGEKERSFSPGNPAVYARDVLLSLDYMVRVDNASWREWAVYCEKRGLTIAGHVCTDDCNLAVWEHLRTACDAGDCTMVCTGSMYCFWPKYQVRDHCEAHQNSIDFDTLEKEIDWPSGIYTLPASEKPEGYRLN